MKFDVITLESDIKHCKNTIKKLKINNECSECIESRKRLLSYMMFIKNSLKIKNRTKKLVYSKSQKRKNETSDKLNKLLYNNNMLTNQELIKKLNISKANFYKNYSSLAKELKEKYKSQSLF